MIAASKKHPKTKICVILPNHWSYTMGGAQFQAKLIVERLNKAGNFDVYCLSNKVGKKTDSLDYTLIQISQKSFISRFTYAFDFPALYKLLKKIQPDFIYQRVGSSYTGIAAHYSRNSDCKLVWNIAHEWDVTPFKFVLEKNLPFQIIEKTLLNYGIQHADHIIAQTHWQKDALQKHYHRTAFVIPNFHPPAKYTRDKPRSITICWIANLKDWKKPDVFIRLARDLAQHEDVHFKMVGRSMLGEQAFKDFIKETKETPNLEYLGAFSQEEVNDLLAESHIFVNTSLFEGFPNTMIQAWLRKTAVASLHVNPDNVFDQDPRIGMYADGSYTTLLEKITLLINDTQLRGDISLNGYNHAIDNHSERNFDKILSLFN